MFANYFHKYVSKWKEKFYIKAEERVGVLHWTACLPVESMFSGSSMLKKPFKTLKLCPLLPGGYIWNVIVHGKHLDDN